MVSTSPQLRPWQAARIRPRVATTAAAARLNCPSSCLWTLPEPPSVSPASQPPKSTCSDILQTPSLSPLRGLQVSGQAPPVPTVPSRRACSRHKAVRAGASPHLTPPHVLSLPPSIPGTVSWPLRPPQTSRPQHHHLRGPPSNAIY